MERRAGARGDSARPLFQYLAASRPGEYERGRASAAAGALGIHGAVLALAVWAMVAATRVVPEERRAEHDYMVELLPPSLLPHALDASRGRAPVTRPGEGAARAAAPAHVAARAARALRVAQVRRPARARVRVRRAERLLGREVKLAPSPGAEARNPTADELAAAPPRPVPYTAPPQLANAHEVQTRLRREYPEQLQDQGIGGRVVLWFLVDENGYVRRYLMKESSGQPGLDRAAMKVARLARFRPAVNYDRHVAVWVALPVLFRTVEPAG